MATDESVHRVHPAQISAWEISQARRLVDILQSDPVPSLQNDADLMSCLYYPLRQVPLPQFQTEMLLWDKDKLNVFSATKNVELSALKVTHGVLEEPAVLYKRADDFTVLALVYSLKSRMAAVYTNEISQTSWEIVGVFSAPKLHQLISMNKGILHSYHTFEDAYEEFQRTKSSTNATGESMDEDAKYWERYDKDPEAEEHPQGGSHKTEEEYWQMYDDELEEKSGSGAGAGDHNDLATRMVLDLVPLYRDCGLESLDKITDLLKRTADTGDGDPSDLLITHQIAWRHTRRVVALVQSQFGPSACAGAISEAVSLISRS